MQNRSRLLMGASALLYLGPLLAGLSGMGRVGLPVFMALFALWLIVMRPAQWPRDLSKWTPEIRLAAAAQLAVNALIVIALFGIGRGIGGIAGYLPHISPLVPVALSFLAIPLSRWSMEPETATDLDRLLDSALRQIGDPSEDISASPGGDEMVAVLLSLAPDSDPILIADAVGSAMKGSQANARLQELDESLRASTNHGALREAVVRWATDLDRNRSEPLDGAQEAAFRIAGADPDLLNLFAHRGSVLLAQQPALAATFPRPAQIKSAISASHPQNLKDALLALAQKLKTAGVSD